MIRYILKKPSPWHAWEGFTILHHSGRHWQCVVCERGLDLQGHNYFLCKWCGFIVHSSPGCGYDFWQVCMDCAVGTG